MFSSKKLLAALLSLLLCLPVSAQVPVTGAGNAGASGPTAPPVDQACLSSAGTTITFTAKNFGNPNTARVTVVSINWADTTAAGTAELTNVTIGGISAVRAVRAVGDNQNSNSEIWYVLNPTGTSGNVVVTSSTNIDAVTITIYALNGYGSPTVTGTGTTTTSNAFTNKTISVAAASRRVNVSTSLSNMTNDYSTACGAGLWGVHASQSNNGTGTLSTTINPTGNTPLIAMATWTSCPNATVCDPYFNNVVLLAGFEGTAVTNYVEQSPIAATLTFSATTDGASQSNMSSTQAEYGTKSARSNNTTPVTMTNNTAYWISDTNTTPLTIEYSFYQTDTANNYSVFNKLPSSGNFQFLVRHTGANWDFFYSNDGTTLNSTTATGAINTTTVFTKYAICKNTAGLIRMFKNGTQIQSATPANSVMFHSTLNWSIAVSGNAQTSYMDNIRITAGVCRYDATSYATATAAFPAQ